MLPQSTTTVGTASPLTGPDVDRPLLVLERDKREPERSVRLAEGCPELVSDTATLAPETVEPDVPAPEAEPPGKPEDNNVDIRF